MTDDRRNKKGVRAAGECGERGGEGQWRAGQGLGFRGQASRVRSRFGVRGSGVQGSGLALRGQGLFVGF